MTDDNRQIAGARERFSQLDTNALREMWSAEGRVDWAETTLREELMERGFSSDELDDAVAQRAQIAERAALSDSHARIPEQSWKDRPKVASGYAQTVKVARWLAFVPAGWQAAYLHGWILHAFGVDRVSMMTSPGDSDLIAFGAAGFLTPIVVVTLGTWVCPAKRKTVPIYALSALCIVGALVSLHTFSRPEVSDALRHLTGLDAIVTMAVSVMIAGVYWLAPWRNGPSSDVAPAVTVGK